MPNHPFQPLRGRVELITVQSEALADNMLGDPATRQVAVYLPEGYDNSGADYPLMVDIVGFTGSGLSHVGWKAFSESVPQRVERLIAEGRMGPVVVALPDCFTSLGGNQYINSLAMGRWADYLTGDMIDAIEAGYRVRRGARHRAIFGKSSGGYGAIVHGMRYPQAWGAVACHSGDMGFEWIYARDIPPALVTLAKHGGIEGFLQQLSERPSVSGGDFMALMTIAMSATYDPDPDAFKGIRLPVDLHTCELDPTRWEAWMAHDPIRLIEQPASQGALRSLGGVFIDCGFRDQYYIHFGMRRFVARLEALGIAHTAAEFDDNHSGIDYRMDTSLPFLYEAITA